MLVNEEIRDKEVRVVDENGPIGLLSPAEGMKIALDRGLDLVKIAPNSVPPVCKIMDYGKYLFEQKKKEKEAKKKQHVIELKEIRLSVKIDVGDLETKVGQAKKFISCGNRVKICVRFKGRELQHPELGFDVIKRFSDLCSDFATPEKSPISEGRRVFVVLSPKDMVKSVERK